MRAHRMADGEDYQGEPDEDVVDVPVTNDAFHRLMDLANEKRREGETVEQAFARLYADPKNRDLVTTEKRMHKVRVAKAMGKGAAEVLQPLFQARGLRAPSSFLLPYWSCPGCGQMLCD